MSTLLHQTSELEDGRTNLRSVFDSLWQARTFIASIASSIFAMFLAIAIFSPKQFTAEASFLPPSINGGASSAVLAQFSSIGGGLLGGVKTSGDQAIGILKSQTIASHMVQRFDLMNIYNVKKESRARAILNEKSDFILGAKDGIVVVHVTDRDPERSRNMTNAYIDELQAMLSAMSLAEGTQRRSFYEQRLAQEKDALADSEVRLKQSQEKGGLISPAGQTASELQSIAQLRSGIASRQVQLASLMRYETEQNPDVVRLKTEISNLQSQVSQMENGKQGPSGDLTRAQVPSLQMEYVRLQREVKYHESLFDVLSRQYEAARLDESHATYLQIIDRATRPDSKSAPKRLLILIVGGILALLVGVASALIRTWWMHTRQLLTEIR